MASVEHPPFPAWIDRFVTELSRLDPLTSPVEAQDAAIDIFHDAFGCDSPEVAARCWQEMKILLGSKID